MKSCAKCGHQNAESAGFCVQCGNRMTVAQRLCPRGHVLEPGATECVYCNAAAAAPAPPSIAGRPAEPLRRRTEVIGQPPPAAPRPPTPAPPVAGRPPTPDRRYTEVVGQPPPPRPPDAALPLTGRPPAPRPPAPPPPAHHGQPVPPPAPPPRRKTEFYSPEQHSAAQARPAAGAERRPGGRKIVGLLLTYSWKAEGQLFPIREGRNFIGRGEQCEVSLADDPSLSERHCHISYQDRFVIGDLVSMAGTHVNGRAVLSQFEPLPNFARLRTGSTEWVFVSLLEPDITPGRRDQEP